MIISFAWTTSALISGHKTMTRRDWSPSHAEKFTVGMLVDAWNQTPRVNSARRGIAIAHKVATIHITRPLRRESTASVTGEDYEREGFTWLAANGQQLTVERIMRSWALNPRIVYVVEFELVEVVA